MACNYDVFREQLGIKYPTYGHALWQPSPGKLYGPVEVGDVGYIREGKFHRLFNALLPANHPSHRNFGVPEFHEPLIPNVSEHIDTGTLSSNHYCSKGITVTKAVPDTLVSRPDDLSQVAYRCGKRQRGAVLILPVQAQSQDTIMRGDFGKWITKHIEGWFAFAQRLGIGLDHMGDIILVTGFHRTRSWTTIAFLESHTDAQVSFGVDVTNDGGSEVNINWQFSHDSIQGAELNRGPTGKNLPEDQCVFLRGFRATRTFKILPKQLKAAAGSSSGPDEDNSEPELELTSIPTIAEDLLHVLSEHIAKRVPECDMVLIHDDDLARIHELCNSNEALQSDTVIHLLRKYQPDIQVLCDPPHVDEHDSETVTEVTKVAMFSEEFQTWGPSGNFGTSTQAPASAHTLTPLPLGTVHDVHSPQIPGPSVYPTQQPESYTSALSPQSHSMYRRLVSHTPLSSGDPPHLSQASVLPGPVYSPQNAPRSSTFPLLCSPPGSSHPPQIPNASTGTYQPYDPRQQAPYALTQSTGPPFTDRIINNASESAPLPPHPSAYYPSLSGPLLYPPLFPFPAIPGGYLLTNSGPPPPSILPRAVTMPIPGGHRDLPEPNFTYPPPHLRMPQEPQSATGGWGRRDDRIESDEVSPQATCDRKSDEREGGVPRLLCAGRTRKYLSRICWRPNGPRHAPPTPRRIAQTPGAEPNGCCCTIM